MISQKTSNDLFNKIRSKFGNITIGDSAGNATADPKQAVFFDFEFSEAEDKFGRVSISLADGESMKVFYNRDLINKIDETEKGDWFAFIKELKDFAVEHQLNFDVRDITKSSLNKQDYQNLADTNKAVNTAEMSEELARITKLAGLEKAPVSEGLTGTSKSSFENLDKTKLIIRHKGKVDENVPGARSRQINSLYIENEDGERFKYPIVHLAGARAMTRHVANGGRPHDDFGQHIIQTSEDIAKLNSFARFVSNKDQLNDSAGDIIEQTKMKLENLRNYVKNLSKQSHYEAAVKDFKTPEAVEMDDATANNYREKFTLKNLDNRVEDALPLIHKVMSEYKDSDMPAPVNYGALVQSFLANPDKKLILRRDPTADKMLSVTKFTDKNTMLSSILSDIAARLLSRGDEEDNIANFASRVADEMEGEGQPFFKPSADYIKNKKIAIQLAKRYIDDFNKMKKDPAYADEVRKDPQEIKKFKNIKGQEYGDKHKEYGKKSEAEQFEAWADSVENEKLGLKKEVAEDAGLTDQQKQGLKALSVKYKGHQGANGDLLPLGYLDSKVDTGVPHDGWDSKEIEAWEKQSGKDSEDWEHEDYDAFINNAPVTSGMIDDLAKVLGSDFEDDDNLMSKARDYLDILNFHGDKVKEDMGEKIANMAQNMTKDEFMAHADELGLTPEEAAEHYEKMQGGAYAGKFEGNEFAQAVQKAKAAGMKSGDKFKVGDKEYTLKDAIELAGLNLNEFFQEEEFAMENSDLTSAYKQIAQLASDVDENPEDAEDQWELASEVARPITKILKQIMDYDKGEQMPDGSDMSYADMFKKVSMLANKGAQTNDPKMAAEIFKTMSSVYDMKQVAEESVSEDVSEQEKIKVLLQWFQNKHDTYRNDFINDQIEAYGKKGSEVKQAVENNDELIELENIVDALKSGSMKDAIETINSAKYEFSGIPGEDDDFVQVIEKLGIPKDTFWFTKNESVAESKTQITESKSQINESREDNAFNISGVDNEINRIVHLAKYQ